MFSIIGLMIYNKYMKDWSYRKLLTMSNMMCSGFYFLDIVIFTRRNLDWGIPDHFFILGSTCQEIVRQWQWMPGIVVMSQLCPKGMEATMFALLAGCHNLGSLIAEFNNLWKASVISTVLPMTTIALIPYLIPDKRRTEPLIVEFPDSATAGSPVSKWYGRS